MKEECRSVRVGVGRGSNQAHLRAESGVFDEFLIFFYSP